jgi:hypothetical protein
LRPLPVIAAGEVPFYFRRSVEREITIPASDLGRQGNTSKSVAKSFFLITEWKQPSWRVFAGIEERVRQLVSQTELADKTRVRTSTPFFRCRMWVNDYGETSAQ